MTGTILAKHYGDYREFAVSEALCPAVRCAWMHRAPESEPAARIAVVPDGCVDLLWTEHGFLVAGPDRTAAFPALRPGETILGLRFRPGAARHLLRCDLDALTGRIIALEDIRPGGMNAGHERLRAANGPLERLRLLQELFAAKARDLPAIRPAATALHALSARLPAETIAAEIGVTERTLRRISVAEFGYGPKTLGRVLRLQKLLGRIAGGTAPLAVLAAEAGFADQAHMNRDVLALTSLTPGEILRQIRG
ncbi:helix-turn-helix domain-containing protein [Shinella sp. BYT-45]|uniref:helix-turn-helix domain-containing protein n=1 Tax=Shinella sp. BYT-45 TaxID=3377377 RepID=UPI00397F73A2